MKLSSVSERYVIIIKGNRAIVTNRCPEDRASGVTKIVYEDGSSDTFVWDSENPEVKVLGKGRLETKIILEE